MFTLDSARTRHHHHFGAAYLHVANPDFRRLWMMLPGHLGVRRGYSTQLGDAWHRFDLSGKRLRFGADQPDVCLITNLTD